MKRTVLVLFVLLAVILASVKTVSGTLPAEETLETGVVGNDVVLENPLEWRETVEEPVLNFSINSTPEERLQEANHIEGAHAVYVVIAADEEARAQNPLGFDWQDYATISTERADNVLRDNFEIDFRILGFIEWQSDDSAMSMSSLRADLLSKEQNHLGEYWTTGYWKENVDAIIGITYQVDTTTKGISSSVLEVDSGICVTLLRWQAYCWDDDLLAHETSHFYYLSNWMPTPHEHCKMSLEPHTQRGWFVEDGIGTFVWGDVGCALTTPYWCSKCYDIMQPNCLMFSNGHNEWEVLALRHGDPYFPYLVTFWDSDGNQMLAGTYCYSNPCIITVVIDTGNRYIDYILIDGTTKIFCTNTVSLEMHTNEKHTIAVYSTSNHPDPPRERWKYWKGTRV